MNKLVLLEKNDLVTTSEILAEGTKKTHKSILENIKEHEKFINEFGILAIESRKSKRGLPVNFYYLNEQQVLYLITLMRNNPKNNIINKFKAQIIKEFFKMRKWILEQKTIKQNQQYIETNVFKLFNIDTIK
jgi:phage regulator Rha-like protein